MAEFCKQCANEMGFDCDFVNLISKEQSSRGFVSKVLCESCGPIQVDITGQCITIGCYENHRPDINIPIGSEVEKIKGYKWQGTLVSKFSTIDKQIRYVVEFQTPEVESTLNIYSPKQIRRVDV